MLRLPQLGDTELYSTPKKEKKRKTKKKKKKENRMRGSMDEKLLRGHIKGRGNSYSTDLRGHC